MLFPHLASLSCFPYWNLVLLEPPLSLLRGEALQQAAEVLSVLVSIRWGKKLCLLQKEGARDESSGRGTVILVPLAFSLLFP